jgi:hypothetical protein
MTDLAPEAGEFDDEPLEVDADGFEIEPGPTAEDLAPVSREDLARAQGWRPGKRTPEGVSLTAEEFLKRGEEEWPLLRHNLKIASEKLVRQDADIAGLRKTVGEQAQAVKDAINLARRASDQGYQRGLAELKQRQREAAATGDVTTYDQVEEQIDAMEQEREAAPAPREPEAPPAGDPPPPAPRPIDPAVAAFPAANPWFGTDVVLRNAMVAAHQAQIALNPHLPQGELLEAAKAQVAQAYPGRIPGTDVPDPAPPRRQGAPVLRPGGAPAAPRQAQRSPIDAIADPAERAAAKDAYRRQSQWDEGFTEAEYMAIYNGDPAAADVLAVRRRRPKA